MFIVVSFQLPTNSSSSSSKYDDFRISGAFSEVDSSSNFPISPARSSSGVASPSSFLSFLGSSSSFLTVGFLDSSASFLIVSLLDVRAFSFSSPDERNDKYN